VCVCVYVVRWMPRSSTLMGTTSSATCGRFALMSSCCFLNHGSTAREETAERHPLRSPATCGEEGEFCTQFCPSPDVALATLRVHAHTHVQPRNPTTNETAVQLQNLWTRRAQSGGDGRVPVTYSSYRVVSGRGFEAGWSAVRCTRVGAAKMGMNCSSPDPATQDSRRIDLELAKGILVDCCLFFVRFWESPSRCSLTSGQTTAQKTMKEEVRLSCFGGQALNDSSGQDASAGSWRVW
jgi:hypothetical protein